MNAIKTSLCSRLVSMIRCSILSCMSALVFCGNLFAANNEIATVAASGECVILMHGLARTNASMRKMNAALLERGYTVVNETYPSREFSIEELSDASVPANIQACREQGSTRIHFVSHSMGGILVRYHLQSNDLPELGRFVMLAPPNQGSEVTDMFGDIPGFTWINGPAGNQLGTGDSSVPRKLGPVTGDTAVIAGTSSINLILSMSLPNPDDGKVSVASTKVDGMCAHLLVPVSHPFIMKDKDVINEVISYLATGSFASGDTEYFNCDASTPGK